jgi:hypothetical protein
MIYLQNAVYAIEELRSVQTTCSQIALANGKVPTYKDYEALLKLAASTYDRAHAPVKHQLTRSAKRTDIWDANVTKSFHEAQVENWKGTTVSFILHYQEQIWLYDQL